MKKGSKKPVGLYLHIPFCKKKCPYCDFFSVCTGESMDHYTERLCERLYESAARYHRAADTLYFGGGTPGLLGAERLCRLYEAAQKAFGLHNAEVTLEVNPEKKDLDFEALKKTGFNRVSIGLQSADDNELRRLGRLHDRKDADNCIRRARRAGFDNLSLDLMLATPGQTKESLCRSIAFCAEQQVQHVSAYLLKIEPGTPFAAAGSALALADEEEQAEMYCLAAEKLEEYGYVQYEISNFARPGYEGRHNLKYWRDEEYLGLGPAAHSFMNGQRFCYGRSFADFYGNHVMQDGKGGDEEEFIMLGLRLTEGITQERYRERFGRDIPEAMLERARPLEKAGYVVLSPQGLALTRKGFLVSNAVLAALLN